MRLGGAFTFGGGGLDAELGVVEPDGGGVASGRREGGGRIGWGVDVWADDWGASAIVATASLLKEQRNFDHTPGSTPKKNPGGVTQLLNYQEQQC